jgi:hypothetical protein
MYEFVLTVLYDKKLKEYPPNRPGIILIANSTAVKADWQTKLNMKENYSL